MWISSVPYTKKFASFLPKTCLNPLPGLPYHSTLQEKGVSENGTQSDYALLDFLHSICQQYQWLSEEDN